MQRKAFDAPVERDLRQSNAVSRSGRLTDGHVAPAPMESNEWSRKALSSSPDFESLSTSGCSDKTTPPWSSMGSNSGLLEWMPLGVLRMDKKPWCSCRPSSTLHIKHPSSAFTEM